MPHLLTKKKTITIIVGGQEEINLPKLKGEEVPALPLTPLLKLLRRVCSTTDTSQMEE